MEVKAQGQIARKRHEGHSSVALQRRERQDNPERPKPSSGSILEIVVSLLCLSACVFFVCIIFFNFYDLGPEWSLSRLPTPLRVLVPSSSHLDSFGGQKAQTPLSLSSLQMMGPLTELKTSVIKPGSGPTVTKGQRVTVHATGSVLQADGSAKKFWSTKDPGQQAGVGQVIAGWDQGVLGMHLGETRMIHIPSKMGYGAGGFPAWGIPANADLQFEIECLQIH